MKILPKLLLLSIILLLAVSLFYRCANKVPPGGGPRDTIPPTLIYSNPKRGATNVHSRVYEFRFDEKIKLQNMNRTLIITPRIDFDYEVKAAKKSFILVFDQDFKDNTTYSFNFRDAVQDITEGNPMKDNIFTFSTGDYLDSLSIEGYAIDLVKKDTLKQATVGLYLPEDTTTILNGPPYYFTQTDEKGHYKLYNIKNGRYLIYGFKDGNSNLQLETKNESYAFKSDTLNLQHNIDSLNLYFVHHDIRDLAIQSALPSGKNFDINFNKYLTSFSVKPVLNDTLQLYANRVKENKSIRIYNTFYNPDSTAIYLEASDSSRNQIEDTVWIKFNESQRKPEELTFTFKPASGAAIIPDYAADIEFNKPIALVDPDSILFRYDTIPVATIKTRNQILANKHLTHFRLNFKLNIPAIDSIAHLVDSLKTLQIKQDSVKETPPQEDQEQETLMNVKKTIKQASKQKEVVTNGLNLYLGRTSFISVESDSLTRTAYNYTFKDPKMVGTLSGTVTTDEKFILQLLNQSDEVVQERYSTTTFTFRNVDPGQYKLRLLIDKNGNRRWDYGNLLKAEEPEPVSYYRTPEGQPTITVRANWDITDINITY